MSVRKLLYLAVIPVFLVFATGCGSNVEKVKLGQWGSSGATYEKAFTKAFTNGAWTEVKDEKGEKVVQFTGKISPGLHDYAVGKLHKSDTKYVFINACSYLAAQNPDGKSAADPEIKFDTASLPIKNGQPVIPLVEGYIANTKNAVILTDLIAYYDQRYWETGSDVLVQWKVTAGGKSIEITKVSNKHWDVDPTFSGKMESVVRLIFGYSE